KAERRPSARYHRRIAVTRRNVMADQQVRAEPAAPVVILRVDRVGRRLAGMDRDLELALPRLPHVFEIGGLIALGEAAQIDAERGEAFEGGALGEIALPDPIDIDIAQRLARARPHRASMRLGAKTNVRITINRTVSTPMRTSPEGAICAADAARPRFP